MLNRQELKRSISEAPSFLPSPDGHSCHVDFDTPENIFCIYVPSKSLIKEQLFLPCTSKTLQGCVAWRDDSLLAPLMKAGRLGLL